MSLKNENKHVHKNLSLFMPIKKIQSVGTSFYASFVKKGSITLEAAIVIPIIMEFLLIFVLIFQILRMEEGVHEALNYAARKTAGMAAWEESEPALLIGAEAYFRKGLKECLPSNEHWAIKNTHITLLGSKVEDNYVQLQATYAIKYSGILLNRRFLTVVQNSCSRLWTGEKLPYETWVYVTDQGECYHSSRFCRTLLITPRKIHSGELVFTRNSSGARYDPCTECIVGDVDYVYITDHGECYHGKLTCAHLKRSIERVKWEQVKQKRGCAYCCP